MTDYMRGQPFGFPDIPHNPVTPRSTSDNSRPPKGLTKSDPTNNQSPDELDILLDHLAGAAQLNDSGSYRRIQDYKQAIRQLKATWERQARIEGASIAAKHINKTLGLEMNTRGEFYIAELEQPNPESESSR